MFLTPRLCCLLFRSFHCHSSKWIKERWDGMKNLYGRVTSLSFRFSSFCTMFCTVLCYYAPEKNKSPGLLCFYKLEKLTRSGDRIFWWIQDEDVLFRDCDLFEFYISCWRHSLSWRKLNIIESLSRAQELKNGEVFSLTSLVEETLQWKCFRTLERCV